jgi:DNA-binding LytR/AlgR family response regulator
MKVRCLLVDDEPPARELMTSYISRLDDLELSGQCSNALEAFAFLQKKEVDLLFLDIHMPRMNGLELVKSLHHRPDIVLITAYRDYAVEGFELDVLDYLVKPVTFERFLKTISKYHHLSARRFSPETIEEADTFENAYMFFKVNKEMVKIFLKDILYIESIKDYLKIVTEEKSYITYQRINYMEEKLPENRFVRIHKSYIVAPARINAFRNDTIRIGEADLPVGRHYKQKFMEVLAAFTNTKNG